MIFYSVADYGKYICRIVLEILQKRIDALSHTHRDLLWVYERPNQRSTIDNSAANKTLQVHVAA